jgi:hypothetical protein
MLASELARIGASKNRLSSVGMPELVRVTFPPKLEFGAGPVLSLRVAELVLERVETCECLPRV